MKKGSATVFLCLGLMGVMATPEVKAAGFATVAPMNVARTQHTATLLNNGKVLVVGGSDAAGHPISSTEIFNPATNSWTFSASLNTGRFNHTATLLPNGRVIVTGGFVGINNTIVSTEIYDPMLDSWTNSATMTAARGSHTATLLMNGILLVAGGYTPASGYVNTAEVFDPKKNTWAAVANLTTARGNFTATLLNDGTVLVVGGSNNSITALSSVEFYDPSANTWAVTPDLTTGRYAHTATLLMDGRLLVAAGSNNVRFVYETNTSEIYDPKSRLWSSGASLAAKRSGQSASLLPNGKLLIMGGSTRASGALSSVEIYDPSSNAWVTAGNLVSARTGHTANLLPDGSVFAAGGSNQNSVEKYDSAANAWSSTANMVTARAAHTATLLPNGKLLVTGGITNPIPLFYPPPPPRTNSAELYDQVSNTWNQIADFVTARSDHTATLLLNGKILIICGTDNTNTPLNSAELYDPASNTWSSAGLLSTPRTGHSATLLPNGKVLVAGGKDITNTNLSTVELYDPATNLWSIGPSLFSARNLHTATLLNNGKVLLVGGNSTGKTEIYDYLTDTWALGGNLIVIRSNHTATLLPTGKVLIAGGYSQFGDALLSAELYDSLTNTFTATGSKTDVHETAILLPNGKVLTAFGYTTSPEMFDPSTNSWNTTASLAIPPSASRGCLLLNGKVLFSGGVNDGGTKTTQVFDDGLLYPTASRPVITAAKSPIVSGGVITLTGTQLKGNSESSGAATNNSASNYPIVQFRSLVNDQTITLQTDPTHPWSSISFTSLPIPSSFPPGYAMVTVFANGIPSVAAIINVVQITLAPSSPTLPNAKVGAQYANLQLTGSSTSSTYAYTFAVTGGSLPAGLSLNSSGLLSGTPTAGGTFNFTVTATTAGGANLTGSQAYTLLVTNPSIVLAPSSFPNATVGIAFSQALTPSGGTAPYSAFGISTGALPAGLALNSSGTISGTPTAGGTFNFIVSVTDSSTGTGPYTAATQSFSLTVAAPTIAISPTSLPNAQFNASYSVGITGSGGTAPYTNFVTSHRN